MHNHLYQETNTGGNWNLVWGVGGGTLKFTTFTVIFVGENAELESEIELISLEVGDFLLGAECKQMRKKYE